MIMKSILTIAMGIIMMVLVAFQVPGNENDGGNVSAIQFKSGSWNEILAQAKEEHKPIFVDISASWCRYCKRMKANVFTDNEVAKFYNSTFINVSVDGEKGEGIELAKKYGVKAYPTFVFLNSDGSLTYQTSGYHNQENFLELGKNANNK
jgi:thiol:disulfide interchange protein